MAIITEEQLNLYMSLFRGRQDIYARRWEKVGKSGYMPAYKFDLNEYLIFKSNGGTFKDFSNKQKIPLRKDIVKKHLIGVYFIGIYPLLDDDSSYFTALDFPYNNKTDDFQLLSKVLIYDCTRNSLICRDVIDAVNKNHKALILTERKEHVEVLNAFLKSSCEVIYITGNDSKSSKNIKLKQIIDGNFQVLITTGQLLGEGFDVEGLSCLFLVFPFSFEGKLIQYIGRISRTSGAEYIHDYRDRNIDFLEKLYKKREKYYKKIM